MHCVISHSSYYITVQFAEAPSFWPLVIITSSSLTWLFYHTSPETPGLRSPSPAYLMILCAPTITTPMRTRTTTGNSCLTLTNSRPVPANHKHKQPTTTPGDAHNHPGWNALMKHFSSDIFYFKDINLSFPIISVMVLVCMPYIFLQCICFLWYVIQDRICRETKSSREKIWTDSPGDAFTATSNTAKTCTRR